MGIEVVDDGKKKDTRNSKDRVATYSQKMKALEYKQIGFFLSPAAHESITKLTAVDNRVNSSLAATTNTLFESLKDKEFIYEALNIGAGLFERKSALERAVKYFNQQLNEVNELMSIKLAEIESADGRPQPHQAPDMGM